MIHNVILAKYKNDYKIEIEFDDGKKGVMDFSKYLKFGGVFEHFHDINFFRAFTVNKELGVISWQNGIEIAPETLYSEAIGSKQAV